MRPGAKLLDASPVPNPTVKIDAQSSLAYGYFLSRQLSVDLRTRELVIDRVCARCGCDYEFGVHVGYFAERAGLTAEQVRSLARGGPGDPCWSDADRAVLRLVDAGRQRHRRHRTWSAAAAPHEAARCWTLAHRCQAGWHHASLRRHQRPGYRRLRTRRTDLASV
jgi:alkylhydroperoxidase family enzyme